MIPFNKPYFTGKETKYIKKAVDFGHISGNGSYTKKCQDFFQEKYNIKKALLTTSCTDALEMCAILLNIKKGDEVIMPSFTFVSTANAFVLRGAKIVFVDSKKENPNIDESKIESLITKKTKAIVVVHYAGVACEMNTILDIVKKHNLYLVEDAAQAINSYYKGKPLGSFGHLSTFSFHETKNIQCGEGGMLAINDKQFIDRAEVIWEKGTNRSAFFRGEVDKYGWVDIGSSFLPSELNAAFLWAQLKRVQKIQNKRIHIWDSYYKRLSQLSQFGVKLPFIDNYATNNAHMFYFICNSTSERSDLINFLKKENIYAVFHYQSLHKSDFYKKKYDREELKYSNLFSDRLIRIPLYFELSNSQLEFIQDSIIKFYE
ncbi:dTDP-4-amino-4,6-dideoxygalactose transaminase [Polaribacter aquimarinus]|uniref:dTDP-4-amino-4,6-dideoxygalactose transaminase n=1 Tax=Polaribacter aquimarinus TaxID=2100726 RepID=A0A2U2J7G2_9FLAO|nr:dTDP-4-amino-4,6-dideoxygalactose transaminase [Polaribacter aquimarinus]PWG04264.1 dTDP-4-amino-4,6-dideoxygalactose transaminase [Polaribacter aquimarinus]